MNLPRPVKHKLFYSKQHLELLDAQIVAHLNAKSDDVVIDPDDDSSDLTAILAGKEIPSVIPLICGDMLQNLRSTLDYLVWELVLAYQGVPNEFNAFPVCKSSDSFKKAAKSRLRGIDPDAAALIEWFQPYNFPQGKMEQSSIFVLDALTNINKHRSILMTRERFAPVEMFQFVDSRGNIGFDPLLATDDEATAIFLKKAVEMKMNTQIAIFIQFNEGPAKGLEITSALGILLHQVAVEILPKFTRFFK